MHGLPSSAAAYQQKNPLPFQQAATPIVAVRNTMHNPEPIQSYYISGK